MNPWFISAQRWYLRYNTVAYKVLFLVLAEIFCQELLGGSDPGESDEKDTHTEWAGKLGWRIYYSISPPWN